MMNMDWRATSTSTCPTVPGRRWHRAVDTARAVARTTSPSPATSRPSTARRYRVADRSIVVLDLQAMTAGDPRPADVRRIAWPRTRHRRPVEGAAQRCDGFSFSDTIAGYVTRFDAERGHRSRCETSDGREFDGRADRHDRTPSSSATSASRTSTRPARCATCSTAAAILFAYGIFYPEGGDARLRGQAHRLRRPRARTTSSSRSPTGGSSRSASSATSTSRAQFGDGDDRLRASTARSIDARRRQAAGHAAGDRHDLAAGLRLRHARTC